jgi:hypothetical protein
MEPGLSWKDQWISCGSSEGIVTTGQPMAAVMIIKRIHRKRRMDSRENSESSKTPDRA